MPASSRRSARQARARGGRRRCEGGEAVGERAPQGALLPGVAPTGLIYAEDRRVLDRLAQLGVGRGRGRRRLAGRSRPPSQPRPRSQTALRRAQRRRGGRPGCAPTTKRWPPAGGGRRHSPRSPRATAPGLLFPQPGQHREWPRCSVTIDRNRRQLCDLVRWGDPTRSCSPRLRPFPQPEQRSGQ